MMRVVISLLLLLLLIYPATADPGDPATAGHREPDVVLSGTLSRADHETYLSLPFEVPPRIDHLTVRFHYDREDRTMVDLGLEDPERFRGWSGGNKSSFFLSETAATPSYLPGPLPGGVWRLVLGVPNIREGVTARYRADIFFASGAAAFTAPFADAPLDASPGWYRGDLHAHSAHSDGACDATSGARVPCPAYRSVEVAAARGLDFLALTEHNARSQHQSLAALQPAFDGLVLLAGREITTFRGHFNVFGTVGPIDFRVGRQDMPRLLERAAAQGGVVAINHPALPSGEACMGCGWQGGSSFDHVSAVEVVNGAVLERAGGDPYGPFSGIPFWERLLDSGQRVTAIAGSDDHGSALPEPGSGPLTVIRAPELSQPALLEGLRAGRVFIDVAGTAERLIDLQAGAGESTAGMGDSLSLAPGDDLLVTVTVVNAPQTVVRLIRDGEAVANPPLERGDDDPWTFRLAADGRATGWIRAEAVDAEGRVLLLTNPVYLTR